VQPLSWAILIEQADGNAQSGDALAHGFGLLGVQILLDTTSVRRYECGMPVPDRIFEILQDLPGLLDEISGSLDTIFAEREELAGLDERLAVLETIVDRWLQDTANIEAALIRLVPSADEILDLLEDQEIEVDLDLLIGALRATPPEQDPGGSTNEVAADALGRLFGITLLHLSIACDIGSLAQLDEAAPNDRPEVVRALSGRPTTISETAWGGLVEALENRLDQLNSPAHLHSDSPEIEAMTKILEQARDVTKAVLTGSAPIAGMVFSQVKAAMSAASLVGPAEFQHALGSIVRHVKRIICKLIRRVRNVVECVSSSYGRTLGRFIDRWADKERERIVDHVVDSVLARVFAKRELEMRIDSAIDERVASGRPLLSRSRTDELDDLLKSNSRWVGPAGTAAKGLHFLWAVQLGPVPAAPIAACVMLAWTLIITGDQLDARGPFPNFWDGVGIIAAR
jgi:hypothetical protein